ncbi:MAG: TIGR01906 family membrane protein [Dehalococcoidia bacterium]
MKYILLVAFLIWILTIPFLIISTSANVYTGSAGLYEYGFDKYQISGVTGIPRTELTDVARQMADYLSGKGPTLQLTVDTKDGRRPLYNEKELTHMQDVLKIVSLFHIMQIVSAILFLLLGIVIYFKMGINRILRGLEIGAIITAAFTAVLITWAVIDFDSLFLLFHYVSFSNNLWILDPSTDYLIMMFPEGFFNDVALFMVATIMGLSVVIWTAAFLVRRKISHNAKAI